MRDQAIRFLRDVIQSGDTIKFTTHGIESLGPGAGWEFTYSVFDDSINIGPAMAEALEGMSFNDGQSTLKIRIGSDQTVVTLSDARTLTILLGDLMKLPAHKHFNFEIS